MAGENLTLGVLFTSEAKQLLAELKRLKQEIAGINNVNKQGAAPANKFSAAMQSLASSFKTVIRFGIAASVIGGFIRALRTGTAEIIEFDQALKNLQAITGATMSEIAAISDTILRLASKTRFSAAELSQGVVLLGQAGFTAAESMAAIEATAALATGTLTNMATTADLMTTTLRAFDLEALEASRVADVMANAVNKSKLTVDKLRIAFNFVGAAAAQAGLSIEQTAATMAVLANNGLRASTIGTGFRQVLAKLIAPNARLRELYVAHGIALEEINPLVVGYEKALFNLTKVLFDTKTGTVDMAKAFGLFKLRGAQAAAIIIKAFRSGNFEKALKNMFAVGTAAEMQSIQAEGLDVKLKNLKDRFGVLAIAIGNAGVAGTMGTLIDLMRTLFDWLARITNSLAGGILVQFTLWATGIWAVINAIKLLLPLISGLIVRVGALNVALFTNPWVLLVVAITAAIIAIQSYRKHADRTAKASGKLAVEQKAVSDSLESYRNKLLILQAAQEDNQEITLEYEAVLQRLIISHPKLKGKIKFTTSALEDNIKVLNEIVAEKIQKRMSQLAETVRKYASAAKEAKKQSKGFLAEIKDFLFPEAPPIDSDTSTRGAPESDIVAATTDPLKVEELTAKEKRALIERRNFLEAMAELGQIKVTGEKGETFADFAQELQQDFRLTEDEIEFVIIKIEELKKSAADALARLKELAESSTKKTDAFFKKLFNQSSAEQQVRLAQIEKQAEGKFAAVKAFAEKRKDLEIDLAAVEAAIRKETNIKALESIKKNEIDALQERIKLTREAIKKAEDAFDLELTDITPELRAEKLKPFRDELHKLQDAVVALGNEFAKIPGVTAEDVARIPGVKDSVESLLKLSEGLVGKRQLTSIQEAIKGTNEELSALPMGILDRFTGSLAEAATGAESLKESFKQMAQSIVTDLIKIIAKMLILKAIDNGLGLFGGSGGGDVTSDGLTGVRGSSFKGATVGGSAGNGNIFSRTAMPSKAFTPGLLGGFAKAFKGMQGGQSGGASGGTTIIIQATDAQSFTRMLASKSAQEMVVSTVQNKFVHNSPLRKSLRRGF